MNERFIELFSGLWRKNFPGVALPIACCYSDKVTGDALEDSRNEDRCLIGNLERVRKGHTFVYSAESPGCPGGKRYTGYSQTLQPNFEYFLSCGIPGKMEGERYKKSPELVREFLKNNPPFKAPAQNLLFKRWDKLSERDNPFAVIFFATADVLSGLFTLANFDWHDPYGVITPMSSGCASIIYYPLKEFNSENPRCVLGMFDVSARPCVPEDTLTFTIPINRFEAMVENMNESFLITQSWDMVKKRIST